MICRFTNRNRKQRSGILSFERCGSCGSLSTSRKKVGTMTYIDHGHCLKSTESCTCLKEVLHLIYCESEERDWYYRYAYTADLDDC